MPVEVPVTREVAVTVEVDATREVEVTRLVEATRKVEVTRNVEVTRVVPVTREVEATRIVDVTTEVEVTREVPVTRQVPVTRVVEAVREVPVTRTVSVTIEVPVTRTIEATREVPVTRIVEVTREVPIVQEGESEDPRFKPETLCAEYPYMIRVIELLRDFYTEARTVAESGRLSYIPNASVASSLRDGAQSDLEQLIANEFGACGLQPVPWVYPRREMTTPEGRGVCASVLDAMVSPDIVLNSNVEDDELVESFLDITNAYVDHCDNDFFD